MEERGGSDVHFSLDKEEHEEMEDSELTDEMDVMAESSRSHETGPYKEGFVGLN